MQDQCLAEEYLPYAFARWLCSPSTCLVIQSKTLPAKSWWATKPASKRKSQLTIGACRFEIENNAVASMNHATIARLQILETSRYQLQAGTRQLVSDDTIEQINRSSQILVPLDSMWRNFWKDCIQSPSLVHRKDYSQRQISASKLGIKSRGRQ